MTESFWHNYRTFRGHMRGKSLSDVATAKRQIRMGPIGMAVSAVVAAMPQIEKALKDEHLKEPSN